MRIPWHHLYPLWRALYLFILLMLGTNIALLLRGFEPSDTPALVVMTILFLLVVGLADRYGVRDQGSNFIIFWKPGELFFFAIFRVIFAPIWFVILTAARLLMGFAEYAWRGLCWAVYRYRRRGETNEDGRENVVRFSSRRPR